MESKSECPFCGRRDAHFHQWLNENGSIRVEPKPITQYRDKGPPPLLEEVQKFVGGWVEILILSDGRQVLFDEEGKLKCYPRNDEATKLCERHLREGDEIVGNAMVLSGEARVD